MSAMVECGHCGLYHSGTCPRVKAIEYYQDGTVKRVEYHQPSIWPQDHPQVRTIMVGELGLGIVRKS